MMKWIPVCMVAFVTLCQNAFAYLGDDMAKTIQFCCNEGYQNFRNFNNCKGDFPISPEVPKAFVSMCRMAKTQCCNEYSTKKNDCDSGIDNSVSSGSCHSTHGITKVCCDDCARGALLGASKGAAACQTNPRGTSSEEMLAHDAFVKCCEKASNDWKESSSQRSSNAITLSTLPSTCEDYAPNELCAHHCIPVPGSYRCECNPGFMLMADGRNCKVVPKNRCKPRNDCHHKCNDNGVEVKCSCRRGYELMPDGKSCQDIDECVLDQPVCLAGTKCQNTRGSYKCITVKQPDNNVEKGKCPPGFTRNIENNACDDINECQLPNPPCPVYSCENIIGGYLCGGVSGHPEGVNSHPHSMAEDRCPPGFNLGVNDECEDVDECVTQKHDCNLQSQFCINKHGSFYCQDKASKHCPPGFKINDATNKCEDINECEDDGDVCRPDQICVNQLGQYNCKSKMEETKPYSCPEGMRKKEGTLYCEDIDECAEGTHICDMYQNCLNTNGSYDCHCKLGYELDVDTQTCVDTNECATFQHDCAPQLQRCDNTIGSYICVRIASCGTGYVLQHVTGKCEDIDECALGTHNCGPGYSCYNIRGSFRCVRRRLSTTSTTPAPEYEYYYDSEEETDNKTSSSDNEAHIEPSTTTTSTTPAPESPATVKIADTTPSLESNERNVEEIPHSNVEPSTFPDIRYSEPKNSEEPDTTPTLVMIPVSTESLPHPDIPEIQPKPNEQSIPTATETAAEVNPTEWLPYQPPQSEQNTSVTEPPPIKSVNLIPPEIPEEELPNVPEQQPTQESEPNNESVPLEFETTPEITYLAPEIPTEKLSPLPPIIVNVKDDKESGTNVYHENDNFWNKATVKPKTCPFGFESDDYGSCFEIDECATNRHSCSRSTEICKNTVGGYLCNCAPGFRRDLITKTCEVITTSSSTTSTTTPRPSPPTTSSNSLFWGYPEYRITSRPFHSRTMCDVGFHYNLKTYTCEDINECKNGQANCADVEICTNTEGGYRCDCPPNWSLDTFRHRCVPNTRAGHLMPPGYGNEPVQPSQPRDNIPVSTGTKYLNPEITLVDNRRTVIKCPQGYRVGDDNSCIDINECQTGEAKCGPQQICSNLPGGYSCNCPSGHKLIGDHQCEDVDECAIKGNMPICSQNADCVNTIGSYRCQCHTGFRSAPVNDKVCVDVDECMAARPGTLCQHRCNNVWGGYRCSCHRGYTLNPDNSTCSDIDECVEFKSKLICVGRCVNEPGSYRCTCPPGYKLSEDKKSCIDIDECEIGEAPCAIGSASTTSDDVCVNTRGSYRCNRIVCPIGYQLENRHRCTKVEKICSPEDWNCTRQPTTISYNFITFVSNLYIPEGALKLFTMKGPAWTNAKMRFELRLLSVNAPPSVKRKATINDFLLAQKTNFEGLMSLVRPLEGPQSIELEMSMDVYTDEQFGGTAIAKLLIYVSEYEF